MARRVLKGGMESALGPETAADALIARTELITNAIRHENLPPGDAIGLTVDVGDHAVHVAVEPSSPADGVQVVEPPRAGWPPSPNTHDQIPSPITNPA